MSIRTVGRFGIESKLGEGGMGSVWKATDPLLERVVALKLLSRELLHSAASRQRFLHEARIASTLHHSGIATVFDMGEADGQVYIAMHFVDGQTVSARLAAEPLAVAEALRIAIEAGEALGYAHANDVIHRDVTSRNIMLGKDGRVVVVDFGLARAEGRTRLTESGAFLGTVAYVAPEVLQGGKADARADVYSLGVVLYEMLTGRLPFTGDRHEAVMYAAVHQEPAPPSRWRPDLPPDLDAVVLRALAKPPDARYQTATELVQALEALAMAGEPKTWKPRRPWLMGLGLLLLTSTTASILAVWQGLGLRGRNAEVVVPRIAVLPLQNLSPEAEEGPMLLEGIGSNLTTKLGRLLGPAVIPWVTSRRFRDASDLQGIAEHLHVDALIVGTLRQAGQKVQVSIALVDGKSGLQSWSEEFVEGVEDIFTLESQIATSSATRLKDKLSGDERNDLERAASKSSEAYLLFLRGSLALQEDSWEATDRAESLFDAALALDPELALAHVGKGAVLNDRYFRGQAGQQALKEAERAFRRALELDPALHAARGGLARIFFETGEPEKCLELGRDLRLRGGEDAEILFTLAEVYFFAGAPELAIPLLEKALDRDPGSVGALWLLLIATSWAGSHEAAIELANQFISRFGPDPEVLLWIGWSYYKLGEFEEASPYFRRSAQLLGDYSNMYVLLYHGWVLRDLGDAAARSTLSQELFRQTRTMVDRFPDNARIRAQFSWAAGALGDLQRLRDEEELFLQGQLDFNLMLFCLIDLRFELGDYARGNELFRFLLRRGLYHQFVENVLRRWEDKDPEIRKNLEAMRRQRQELLAKHGVLES